LGEPALGVWDLYLVGDDCPALRYSYDEDLGEDALHLGVADHVEVDVEEGCLPLPEEAALLYYEEPPGGEVGLARRAYGLLYFPLAAQNYGFSGNKDYRAHRLSNIKVIILVT